LKRNQTLFSEETSTITEFAHVTTSVQSYTADQLKILSETGDKTKEQSWEREIRSSRQFAKTAEFFSLFNLSEIRFICIRENIRDFFLIWTRANTQPDDFSDSM